jgi:hypothetical protein
MPTAPAAGQSKRSNGKATGSASNPRHERGAGSTGGFLSNLAALLGRPGASAQSHEERFVDLPPAQVWAQLLDASYVPPCSIRTMYRVLAANAEVA